METNAPSEKKERKETSQKYEREKIRSPKTFEHHTFSLSI
jgi:hypothetical protein